MAKEPLGLYLHIPFCRSKCPYCDFCSFPRPDAETVETYVSEMIRRMEGWRERCAERSFDTVYLGGGTPTLLSARDAERLLRAVYDCFDVQSDAEVTVECNPGTGDREAFAHWQALGVNRLSMGAQSAQRDELKALGRLHDWDTVVGTVNDARAAGIHNINMDFMLGIPLQTEDSLTDTLRRAVALKSDHLSTYCLILEDGTPFARRGATALALPDDDRVACMYELTASLLTDAGYEHYEISNYARPGRRSRHNLHTWQAREYLGLGVAAHSYLDGVRFGNSRDLDAFLHGEDITAERNVLTPEERADESVMLGLRLSDGVDTSIFSRRFGMDFETRYGERCRPFLNDGLMERSGDHIRISERGWLVSNAIIANLL